MSSVNPQDRDVYWRRALLREGAAPETMDTEILTAVLERNLRASSRIVTLMLPDLLALDEDVRPEDPRDERINVPGTDSERNWHYRMPITIDELASRDSLNARIAHLLAIRSPRSTSGEA